MEFKVDESLLIWEKLGFDIGLRSLSLNEIFYFMLSINKTLEHKYDKYINY